jgi:hypothetical protein
VLGVGTAPVIIDYGLSEEAPPVGIDGARLFGGVVRSALSNLALTDLTEILMESIGLAPRAIRADGPVEWARQILETLTGHTARIIGEKTAALWPYHLYGFSCIALKWPHGTTDEYRASFLLGAIALTKLLGPPAKAPTVLQVRPGRAPESLLGESRRIKLESPAEILILVAQFEGHGELNPTARIYGSLADHVHELIPGLGRVERIEASVASRKDAVALAAEYKASMIVWGTFDGLGVSPRYDVTRDSLVMKRSATQLDQATRHALGERFEPYITQSLADEVSFLSLVAVSQICVLNLNYEAAISVLQRALTLVSDRERAQKLDAAGAYSSLAAGLLMARSYPEALSAVAKARDLALTNVFYEVQELALNRLLKNPVL